MTNSLLRSTAFPLAALVLALSPFDASGQAQSVPAQALMTHMVPNAGAQPQAVGELAANQILTLDVAGTPVAAQLVLTAPDGSYLGLSGVDPAWWHVSPVTLLQLHAAELAVEQGQATFNLSVGPSVSKLRWSEQVRQHPEFLVCGPRWSSRLAYAGYRMAAAAAAVHRESRRHRTAGGHEPGRRREEGDGRCTSSS